MGLLNPTPILLLSCKPKVDTDEIKKFAQTIHDNTRVAESQKLISALTADALLVQQNSNSKINTDELKRLLFKTRVLNQLYFEHINSLKEIDYEINLKKKVLDENLLYKSLLSDQFPYMIWVLKSNDKNRLSKISKVFNEGLRDEIKTVQTISLKADADFAKKYRISIISDSVIVDKQK